MKRPEEAFGRAARDAARAGWRVFPWSPGAGEGEPFSASFVPRSTGRGRFDLPVTESPVLYLAEAPEHAVAELLEPWRGRSLGEHDLERAGLPLAVAAAELAPDDHRIADLCDPDSLAEMGIAPDRIASRDRRVTQAIALDLWHRGRGGLRCWSRFWGEWHTVVLFTDRARPRRFGMPEALTLETRSVRSAAEALRIEIPG